MEGELAERGEQVVRNAFSVDVEEHFQVLNLQPGIDPSEWDSHESRIGASTRRLMDVMEDGGVRGTFFILGWVAERQGGLVRQIHARGHEVASHGWSHTQLTRLTRASFREEAERTKKLLEDLTGTAVLGFRAPSFSIRMETFWALDILLDLGYRYDSSIFPIRHPDYGVAGWKKEIHQIRTPSGRMIAEFPLTVASFLGKRIPVSGGGYFRLFPYGVTRWGIRQVNRRGRPAIFYVHPWELDPGQPNHRRRTTRSGAFRHYTGIRHTEGRLKKLVRSFDFAPCRDILEENGFL